jgi:hypothetical protein
MRCHPHRVHPIADSFIVLSEDRHRTSRSTRDAGRPCRNRHWVTAFAATGLSRENLVPYGNARPDRINHVGTWSGRLDPSGLFAGSAYQIADREITPAGVVEVLRADLASAP